MLLTVTTTHQPATDLGYLLHKHPDRVQEFTQSFGTATVFYPEATDVRCTVALMLHVDPVRLARSRAKNAPDFSLAQYVNDRSYAASSLLGVAMADVFSTPGAGAATPSRSSPTPRFRSRSSSRCCRAAADPRSLTGSSSRWAGPSRPNPSRSTTGSPSGETPAMSGFDSPAS